MAQIKSDDLSQLDFDQIKDNLKTFLRDQSTFSDYDFEGSGLSLLLDVLAYNTHYNAYIGNMFANEMFLDSAVKRSSAVSLAKHLGYTPSSIRSARANIDVTVFEVPDSPATITLDAKTPFTTSIKGNSFTFFNLESTTLRDSGAGRYNKLGLQVVEGTLRNLSFAVATPGPDEKYEIPDLDIDTSTLKVSVQGSFSNTSTDSYNLTVDTTNVTSSSRVFYLEMNPQEKYQIFFGDGVIGNKLISGNLVKVEYLKSKGKDANTSDNASIDFETTSIGGSSNVAITTTTNPSSGSEADTLSSIKFKAPRVNAARNRAVTANDYKALIEENFTDAESVIVFGGEDNIPPKFGKVIISLKPFDGFSISQSTKDSIISSVLANKKVMAVQPEFVDPEFFFVNLEVNVEFNSLRTTLTSDEIETLVTETIDAYFSSDLQKFDKDFVKSKLISNILSADTSISSVIILVKLQKRENVNLNAVNTFRGEDSIKFGNRLQPGTISSSRFFELIQNTTTLVNMTDVPDTVPADNNGTGTIVIRNASTEVVLNDNVGNVNYQTGEIILNEFTPTALPENVSDFRFTSSIQEVGQNIEANRNQILLRDKTTLDAAAGRDAGLVINVTATQE